MGLNNTSLKIIRGAVTSSQTSAAAGSFAKEVNDFIKTVKGAQAISTTNESSGSMGYVLDIKYVPNTTGTDMTAFILISGSLPS